MALLREQVGELIKNEYSIIPSPAVLWNDEYRELQGVVPIIKTYSVGTNAMMKGLGYTHRKVLNHLTVDIKCRGAQNAHNAKDEVIRILGKHRKSPFTGYDIIEFDDGTQHAGYSGFYWWTVEVKVWTIRKPVQE